MKYKISKLQNFLVLQPMYRLFENIGNSIYISACNFKELSGDSIKFLAAPDNSLVLLLNYIGVRPSHIYPTKCGDYIYIAYEEKFVGI